MTTTKKQPKKTEKKSSEKAKKKVEELTAEKDNSTYVVSDEDHQKIVTLSRDIERVQSAIGLLSIREQVLLEDIKKQKQDLITDFNEKRKVFSSTFDIIKNFYIKDSDRPSNDYEYDTESQSFRLAKSSAPGLKFV